MPNTSKYKSNSRRHLDSYSSDFYAAWMKKIRRDNKAWLHLITKKNNDMKFIKIIVSGGIGKLPFFLIYIIIGLCMISIFQYRMNAGFWTGVGIAIFGGICMMVTVLTKPENR